MSRYVSDLNVVEFDKMVKRAYSHKAILKPTVRVKNNVEGASCRFQKSGLGMATKKIPQADVTMMNIDYSYVTAYLEDWDASDLTDLFSRPKINFDEKSELANAAAEAIRRREDQIIIDTLEEGATQLTVGTTVGDTAGMNTGKFRRSKYLLDNGNVPKSDRVFLMSSEALSDMLGTTEATSSDYASIKALVHGEINTWLNFTVYDMGVMPEGGLPKTGDTRSAFAYHKSSIGLAIGIDMFSSIDWVPLKKSWLVSSDYSAGAITIDNTGMVTISHTEQS